MVRVEGGGRWEEGREGEEEGEGEEGRREVREGGEEGDGGIGGGSGKCEWRREERGRVEGRKGEDRMG